MFEQSSRRARRGVGLALAALLTAGVLVPVTALGAAAEEGAEPAAASPYPTTTTRHIAAALSSEREFCDRQGDGIPDVATAGAKGRGTAEWLDSEAVRNAAGVALPQTTSGQPWWSSASTVAGSAYCIQDTNGDGFDDIVQLGAVTARVFYLNLSGESSDASTTNGAARFITYTFPTGNRDFGITAAGSAGDLDRDGYGDFVVSQHLVNADGRTGNGRLWVLAGRSSPTVPTAQNITMDETATSDPVNVAAVITGEASGDQLGTAKSVGDVNGDGIDDLLVASPASQKAWLIWGKARGLETRQIDLADLDPSDGALFATATGGSGFGAAISTVDDVNGDGVQDYVFGRAAVSPATVGAASDTGGAVVVFGAPIAAGGTPDPVAVDTVTKTVRAGETPRGYVIEAEATGDALGFAVAGGGDYNGDGRSDLLLGAPGFDPVVDGSTVQDAGAVYVVYGKADSSVQPLVELNESEGYRIDGEHGAAQAATRPSRLGYSVSRVGDIDDNGVEDYAYNAPGYSPAQNGTAGIVFVALRGDIGTQLALEASARVGDSGAAVSEQNDVFAAGEVFDLRANLQLRTLRGYSGDVAFAVDGKMIEGCGQVRTAVPQRSVGITIVGTVHQSFGYCDAGIAVSEYGIHRFGVGFAGAGHVQASETESIPVYVTDTSETALEVRRTESGRSLRLTATVTPESSEKTVDEGTVVFSAGDETLAEIPVSGGTAAYTVPLPVAGEYEFGAEYTGYRVDKSDDSDELVQLLAASEGSAQHTVVSDPATAAFQLSRDTAEWGETVTAIASTGGTGSVRFTVDGGDPVEVPVVNGVAEHPLTGLDVGEHTVVAVFVPEDGADPVPAGGATLTVTKASTALSAVRLSRTSTVYGTGGVTANVRVTGTDTGSVTFWNGATRLGAAQITGGQASAVLPKTLAAGKRQITARLSETGTHGSATAAANTVTVAKAKTSKVTVTAKKFKKGTKPTVTVRVAKLNNGTWPVGKVRVQVGSTKKTVTLSAAKKGRVTVKLAKKYRKSLTVRATFLPKDAKNVASKTSAKQTIGVKK